MPTTTLQMPFLTALIIGVLFLLFLILQPFLITLSLAVLCAILLTPLYKKILSHVGNKEVLATWMTLSISIVGIVIPLTFLGTQLFDEAVHLYSSLSQDGARQHLVTSVMENTGRALQRYIPGAETYLGNLSYDLDLYIKNALVWVIDHLGVALSGVSTFLLDLLIFLIALYYLLKDGNRLKKIINAISPLGADNDEIVFDKLHSAINSVIKGNFLIALIQGLVTSIGFLLTGVPNGILWGMLAVVASLVPRIGTALIIVPGIIYLFIMGSPFMAFFLAMWGIFVVGVIDNILGPKLIGKEMELHPLSVLLSVMGGLLFFGPVGIFLGPLTISFLFALVSLYADITKKNDKG